MKTIAVIGAGAISESFHLPALRRSPRDLTILLVDPDQDRALEVAKRFGIEFVFPNHRDVLDRADAAVIASPHHTHVAIATDFVDAGLPVLSEKPLGTTLSEVATLEELSNSKGVTVAVNQTRRFIPACAEIRDIIRRGELGDSVKLQAIEGDKFGWPAATPSMFGARSAGKGVLLDIGAHVLDLVAWWFGDDLQVVDYVDDSFGGSEAVCHVRLEGPSCEVEVRLSWIAKQSNAYVFSGGDDRIEWMVYDLDRFERTSRGGSSRTVTLGNAPASFADLAPKVIEDFIVAATSSGRPLASASDAMASMRLIEECYARRRRFDMPWHQDQTEVNHG